MRLISALLCFCLTFNVMAASGTVQELEKALDNYQYALTVEWDQNDSAFMTEKTDALYSLMSELMAKGLTKADIMNVVAKKTKNPKELEALKLRMELLANNANSASDLAKLITEESKNLYSTGASWEGAATAAGIVSVVLFGSLIAYMIWYENNYTCEEASQSYVCGWVSYTQDGQQRHQCWYEPACTRYVEN